MSQNPPTEYQVLALSLDKLNTEMHALRADVRALQSRSTSHRVWDVLVKVVVPISFVLAGTMVAHEVRLSGIEGNRFTATQGLAAEHRSVEQARLLVAESEARFAKAISQLPPDWLSDLVKELKEGQADISKRLTVVETRVQAVHANNNDK